MLGGPLYMIHKGVFQMETPIDFLKSTCTAKCSFRDCPHQLQCHLLNYVFDGTHNFLMYI